MKANYKVPTNNSEVSFGTLYEMNQQLMAQAPKITETNLQLAKDHMITWVMNQFSQKYLMLLNNDLHDYTLFNLDKSGSWYAITKEIATQVVDDVIECMTNRGELLDIEEQQNGAWEIWLKSRDNCYAYYLFPYGQAVLEY